LTLQRWAEEIKILHGDFVMERVIKLADHVSLALLPAAKQAKIREERELALRCEAQAKAEAEAAAQEKQKAEEAARQESEGIAQRDTSAQLPGDQDTMEDIVVPAADVDSEMIDASNSTLPLSPDEPTPDAAVSPLPAESSTTQAESSRAERITVIIHGSPVDITDTGIDPTFLEALPDDMREEVLNQHVRDQRASRVERPPDSQISSEFLDALPPEIRAEIIQQERLEQARRREEEAESSERPAGLPDEIDPVSFIASIDPQLRQSVLLEREEGFIQSLPSHIMAEAGAYHDDPQNPRRQLPTRSPLPRSAVPRKLPHPHDAIQLLDKGGIAVLVRLLFFPQVLRKNLLFKVLVNLCENAKTRTEVFNLLLNVLQDGTGDLAAVDKSFAQMSFRNSKNPSQQTPKAAGKQRAGSEHLNALALPNLQDGAIPDLVAQRCLEALTFIVSTNELSSLFFLTEHELPAGLRRAATKKGKGKERQMPQTHYPIVLLLGLLDRQSLLKTPSIMESVVGLLATVTRPLTSIKIGDKKDLEPSISLAAPEHLPATPQPSIAPQPEVDTLSAQLSFSETRERLFIFYTPVHSSYPTNGSSRRSTRTFH
jgi:E3 ubiquitin-protein ligase HUWE1